MRLFEAIIGANHREVGGGKEAGLHAVVHPGSCAHLISTRLQPGVSGCPVNKTRFNGFILCVEAVETASRWSATIITGLKPGANGKILPRMREKALETKLVAHSYS